MSRLSNTPRQQTVLRLEARKSFAFGMKFRNARRHPINMATAEVRMVIGRPKYQGGGQLLTKDATVVDAALGLVQFELQASDLDLDEGEYSFTVVIEGQHGYSTVVLKGVIDLVDNDEFESTTRTFSGINPSTNLAVSLEEGNLVDVQVDSVDGLTVIVEDRISDFTGQMDALKAATESTVAAGVAAVEADRAYVEARVVDDLGTTDGQTKALFESPTSQTRGVLNATIGSQIAGTVPGLIAGQIADANPAIAAAAADYAASGVGVLTAERTPTFAENRSPDPQAKTSGGVGGSSSLYDLTRITTGLPAGFSYGLQVVRKGTLSTAIGEIRLGDLTGALRIPVTPGEQIAATARIWTDQAAARARLSLSFLDSGGALVVGGTITGDTTAIAASTWETRAVVGVVPATAAHTYAVASVLTVSGNTVTGAVTRATGLHPISGGAVPAAYGDGTREGWLWRGTAHESTSKKAFPTASDLSTGGGGGSGGTTDADLLAWATSEAFVPTGSIVRNGDGVMTSAAIKWPDASTGTFTATDTTGGYLNAYTATHVTSGKKVTQPAVTRNSAGDVTAVPTPTVGAI